MNERGETEGGIMPPAGSTIGLGERYGTEYGAVPYDEAGRAAESGGWEKNPGLWLYSDGDAVVAADIGYCLYSIPYPDEVSILKLGPNVLSAFGCWGIGAKMFGL